MTREVFISYRRADTSGHAGRISDDLERHFGHQLVFRDIDSINAGEDFITSLEKAIRQARVCLVLIGDTWLHEKLADGTRRLDDPEDHVRREIEQALSTDSLMVLPVLVEGARMPAEVELPPSLQKLARLQAIELSESRWNYDITQLAKILEEAAEQTRTDHRSTSVLKYVLPVVILGIVLAGIFMWRNSADQAQAYTGLWYLPNGSFWTVREQDEGLWVDETHYESLQVWKRGPAEIQDDELVVTLDLVFERTDFNYVLQMGLSRDEQILSGESRRSDLEGSATVVLTRAKP